MTDELEEKLRRTREILQEKNPILARSLGKPATAVALDRTSEAVGRQLPRQLYNLYRWANGTSIIDEEILSQRFIPDYYFLNLRMSRKYWKGLTEAGVLEKRFFPILDNLSGDSFVVELQEPSSVWLHSLQERVVEYAFPDIVSFIEFCNQVIEASHLTRDGLLAIDSDTKCELGFEVSGGLEYWRELCGY